MSSTTQKTIGILGGMGPKGTSDFYLKIIQYYQVNFSAKYDQDFPPMIIYSVPIPDVVENLANEKTTIEMLSKAAQTLEKSSCDFIFIACNTVQYLINKIQTNINIPIINIAKINAKKLQNKNYKKIAIIATKTTIEKNIYQPEFKKIGIKIIKPNQKQQKQITKIIMQELAGQTTEKNKKNLIQIIKDFKNQKASAVLIACTDLPPLINQTDTPLPLIDCTKIYAEEAGRLSKQI